MACKIFINTYQRYKKQTDLETAEQYGYKYPSQSAAESKKSNSDEVQPYRIRLAQFQELAAGIVNGKEQPSIPRALINLLIDTISLRKDFAQFLRKHSKQASSKDAESTHTHFIKQLEEVLEILKPVCPEASPVSLARSAVANNNGAISSEPKILNMENRFSNLEVEELDDFDYVQKSQPAPLLKSLQSNHDRLFFSRTLTMTTATLTISNSPFTVFSKT